MIKYIKEHKIVFLLVLVFIILLSFYGIREFFASRDIYTESFLNGEDYIMAPKTYGVNEYSPLNVTVEQMVVIYMNDFKYNIYNDMNAAYLSLNEQYRNIKFGDVNNFNNYVNNLSLKNFEIDKYSVSSNNKKITIYTKGNDKYIFKIISVMEYEVYLDDYTVEI